MIEEIPIEPFEESEYDLSNIGLEGFTLVVESNENYILTDFDKFTILNKDSFLPKDGQYILSNMDEEEPATIIINDDQYNILIDLLYTNKE